jgi:hypothetical protein
MEEKNSSHDSHFVTVAGLQQVYQPATGSTAEAKKHPCKDCHFCQFCSDARCCSCRGKQDGNAKAPGRKLSIKEQIALYEQINRKTRDAHATAQESPSPDPTANRVGAI